MEPISLRPRRLTRPCRRLLAIVCVALLAHGEAALLAQEAPQGAPAAPAEPAAEKLSADQLDSLVAPIALYPDPLLAQTLAASTYPLELIQLQQWLKKNEKLKDKALADAVAKQPWDPSVQSMAAVPDVVNRLANDIQWTTQLGDAFLDQQSEVMDAVQRMRKKAEDKGALTSNEQQKVETKVIENKTVIVVEPTNPEVVYVPSYNPTVVYPPPVYPYPPVYYPPYYPGAGLVTFGVGMAMGAAIWGGSCCGCGWGGNNTININNNNNFNRNTNVNRGQGGGNRGQGGNWQHNSQHRGGAPYSNKATANKYGGSTKGSRQAGAQRQGGGAGARPSASSATRGGGGAAAGRGGAGAGPSASSRGGGSGAGPSASSASRGGGAGASRGATGAGGGGSRSSSAFGGGSSGFSGSSARASSSRGSSSMSSRGGGSRGGGSRGGGGRRR